MAGKKRRSTDDAPDITAADEVWVAPDLHRIISGKDAADPVKTLVKSHEAPGNRLLDLADVALSRSPNSRLKRRRTDPQ